MPSRHVAKRWGSQCVCFLREEAACQVSQPRLGKVNKCLPASCPSMKKVRLPHCPSISMEGEREVFSLAPPFLLFSIFLCVKVLANAWVKKHVLKTTVTTKKQERSKPRDMFLLCVQHVSGWLHAMPTLKTDVS